MKPVKRCLLKAGSAVAGKQTNGVRFLLFHEINSSQMGDFENLIHFIRKHFNFIAPDEYDRYVQSNGVYYIISFDDGFASQFDAARNILDPLEIKALFFICPRFTSLQGKAAADFARGAMRRSDIEQMTPELQPISWSDLLSLSAKGHVVGSHGMNHFQLSKLALNEDLTREIISSGDELAKRLGQPVDWFAYPFGDINSIDSRSLRMIAQRYKYCCSGLRGINDRNTNRLCLTRENVNHDELLGDLKLIAQGGFDLAYYFQRNRLLKMVESG